MRTSRRRVFILSAIATVAAFGIFFQSGIAQKKSPIKTGTASQASAEFKRLLDLQAALKRIPMSKQNKEPHKSFLKRNEKKVVYSDPSAEYYVRSELFWALREKYKDLAIADEIAWVAAKNPLPGECEGYLNCYLYTIRSTDIEYLRFYPNGKHTKKALQEIIDGLASTVADLGKNEGHTGPTDPSDKTELAKQLAEMRLIVLKVPHPDSSKLLAQIKQIEETYK